MPRPELWREGRGVAAGAGVALGVSPRQWAPRRSRAIQYHEGDRAVVSRLLAEEGLFWWFEHAGDAASDALGAHTLVIADHNGAFKPAATSAVQRPDRCHEEGRLRLGRMAA